MAKVVTDNKHYQDIADAIRTTAALSPDIAQYKPSEMADGVRQAGEWQYGMGWGDGYNAGAADTGGYDEGFSDGYNDGFYVGEQSGLAEGVEQGKQAEYDRFWDEYQQNGNRTDARGFFAGGGWNAQNMRPKYDICPTGAATNMFWYMSFEGDLAQHFQDLGITIDLSKATQAHSLFNSAQHVSRVGVIDLSSCSGATSSMFSYCSRLVTIDKLVIVETTAWTTAFNGCTALENITVEGTVGQNGLNLQWSTKLSKASIESVVNALSATTSGLSVTLSKTAVNAAFATTEGGTDGSTSTEWTTLANTKSNWTINLV